MAIGALQTGYNTLYGKVAGLGTQNGQTRGSSFREHIDGTEKKAPYQHLAQNGTITYKGVTFVCDTDRNRITLGDVTDRSKCLNISLKDASGKGRNGKQCWGNHHGIKECTMI